MENKYKQIQIYLIISNQIQQRKEFIGKQPMINGKWIIYIVTFLTYSLIHSIRTCWGSLKPILTKQPYNFSDQYLGVLDMIVLFTLAISLNLFGGQIQKYSIRKCLFLTMLAIIIDLTILFCLLITNVSNQVVYFVIYALMGIISCLGWPLCLYTLSQYFDSKNQATALSMWNSVSQFGDLLAFMLTYIIITFFQIPGAYSLVALIILLSIMIIIDYKFFKINKQIPTNNIQFAVPQNKNQLNIQIKKQENLQIDSPIQNQSINLIAIKIQKINFITVWCLPGVSCTVVAYSIVKSINAVVVFWLIMYLINVDNITKGARIIAVVWPVGITIGAYIGSKLNHHLSYGKFMVSLFIAGILFLFLDEIHNNSEKVEVVVLLFVTSIAVGGPYNQMSTAVPLKLSQDQNIRSKQGAKAAIISLMEGFGQMMCGLALLIVPSLGVIRLNQIAAFLCGLSFVLLGIEILRKRYAKPKQLNTGQTQAQAQQLREMSPLQTIDLGIKVQELNQIKQT